MPASIALKSFPVTEGGTPISYVAMVWDGQYLSVYCNGEIDDSKYDIRSGEKVGGLNYAVGLYNSTRPTKIIWSGTIFYAVAPTFPFRVSSLVRVQPGHQPEDIVVSNSLNAPTSNYVDLVNYGGNGYNDIIFVMGQTPIQSPLNTAPFTNPKFIIRYENTY